MAGALLPRGRPLGDVELCVVKSATGVPCPSCGITRSIVELSHGHLADSVRFHPLGPALFLVLAAIVAFPVLPGGLRDRLTLLSRSPAAAMACAATIVAVWAMRLWLGMLPS